MKKNLIKAKAKEMNPKALYCCNSVSIIIKQLNDYIDGRNNLNEERIASLLDHLVGYYTVTLDIPLDAGLKILSISQPAFTQSKDEQISGDKLSKSLLSSVKLGL